MKSKNEEAEKSDETATAQDTEIAPAVDVASDEDFSSELNQPRWSVVSFEKVKLQSLTYAEASQKLKEYADEGISGLCIVTDEAAARI